MVPLNVVAFCLWRPEVTCGSQDLVPHLLTNPASVSRRPSVQGVIIGASHYSPSAVRVTSGRLDR